MAVYAALDVRTLYVSSVSVVGVEKRNVGYVSPSTPSFTISAWCLWGVTVRGYRPYGSGQGNSYSHQRCISPRHRVGEGVYSDLSDRSWRYWIVQKPSVGPSLSTRPSTGAPALTVLTLYSVYAYSNGVYLPVAISGASSSSSTSNRVPGLRQHRSPMIRLYRLIFVRFPRESLYPHTQMWNGFVLFGILIICSFAIYCMASPHTKAFVLYTYVRTCTVMSHWQSRNLSSSLDLITV